MKSKLKTLIFALAPLVMVVSSCSRLEPVDYEVNCNVYGFAPLPEMDGDILYEYDGTYISVDKQKRSVCGTIADTSTILKMSNGKETKKVRVNVQNRPYVSHHSEAENKEGWFDRPIVEEIGNIKTRFINGVDVSSCKYLYDHGQRFYNEKGREVSLFKILKDNGVNWVRFRLWNDPYNHSLVDGDEYATYGGGACDLNNVTWMINEAKRFRLKVLLDFHYSDFWADPGMQVVPKKWKDLKTVDEFQNAIYRYTKETLQTLKNEGLAPNMVSIGNEITSGILLSKPGTDVDYYTGKEPKYQGDKEPLSAGVSGQYASDNTNLIAYLSSGASAVREIIPDAKIMLHVASDLKYADWIKNVYNDLSSVDYDVIGLSAYSYYHWSSLSVLADGLSVISEGFPDKEICIAETSYGYTYETDSNADNSFAKGQDTGPINGYECSIQGQANIIRDTIATVHALNNGIGTFYWEPAWTPTRYCGWADRQSKATWSNQGLFSYDGKALGSLSVYNQIK